MIRSCVEVTADESDTVTIPLTSLETCYIETACVTFY